MTLSHFVSTFLTTLFPFTATLSHFLNWLYLIFLETFIIPSKSSLTSQDCLIYRAPLYSINWSYFQDASLSFLSAFLIIFCLFLSFKRFLNQSWSVRNLFFGQTHVENTINYNFLMIYHSILGFFFQILEQRNLLWLTQHLALFFSFLFVAIL